MKRLNELKAAETAREALAKASGISGSRPPSPPGREGLGNVFDPHRILPPSGLFDVKPWHALFAPLPRDAVPRRKPVAPPELAAATDVSPIAGWNDLVVDLSDPQNGGRIVHVVVDAEDRPISASDHVLFRLPNARMRQESVGGRIEADGTFNGTHWDVEGVEPERDEEPNWDARKRAPTADEIAALLNIVAEIVHRGPPRVA